MKDKLIPKIDELLLETKSKPDQLNELTTLFLILVSQGDFDAIVKYKEPILERLKAFPDHPDTTELCIFINAIFDYFLNSSVNAEKLLLSILPPHKHWENKETQGAIELITGGNYRSLGEYDKSIKHLSRVLNSIPNDSPLLVYRVMAHYQLAEAYIAIDEFQQAEKYLLEGLTIGSETIIKPGRFRILSGLGNLYLKQGRFEESKIRLDQAKEIAGAKPIYARALYDLALYYKNIGDLEESLKYCDESYTIREELKLEGAATSVQIIRADIFIIKKEYQKAIDMLLKTLTITEKLKSITKSQSIHKQLATCYEHQNEWEKSLFHFKSYEEIKSNLHATQQKEIFKLKNKEISNQKDIIEHIHQEVQDSIKYAKRIQEAILPAASIIESNLKNSFILYLPKDVVAGDFYWCEKQEDGFLIAAADCTGHGVPGAMVSVVCNNALNRSVREFSETQPAKILDQTRKMVIETFESSSDEVKDGMDIALCKINNNSIQYAGANNPLWIFKSNATTIDDIIEIKPCKQPIGKYAETKLYVNHQIDLESGDMVYFFTDGYADQFGGPKGKKLKYKPFKELLFSIKDNSPESQKESLLEAFESWRGDLEQVDDICVIGVRI